MILRCIEGRIFKVGSLELVLCAKVEFHESGRTEKVSGAFWVNFQTNSDIMLNAWGPYANCDIAICDGIYGIDLIVHLLVNDMGLSLIHI